MLIRFGTIRASKNSARKSSTEDTNQRILGRRGHVGLGEAWTDDVERIKRATLQLARMDDTFVGEAVESLN